MKVIVINLIDNVNLVKCDDAFTEVAGFPFFSSSWKHRGKYFAFYIQTSSIEFRIFFSISPGFIYGIFLLVYVYFIFNGFYQIESNRYPAYLLVE